MKVVVVGSGGREHALAATLGHTADVIVAPGNAGIPGSMDLAEGELSADLVVVGPEAPLVDGLADRLRGRGLRVFGPGGDGARLEGSKTWMKQLFDEAKIPTARYGSFDAPEPALAFLETLPGSYVVKTDGLAAGKGVLVTSSLAEARDAVQSYLSGEPFGDAGRRVVVEEGLSGPELSVFAICDGTRVVPIGNARDHKRVGDGDTGPNTGGMGAFSPVPGVDEALIDRIFDEAIEPTVWALRNRGIDYRGFLFCGLMLTPEGPKVLEYNVRFGDPEAQVVLPRVTGDLADALARAADGDLREAPALDDAAAVTVVCASEGYPTAPRTGDPIEGLDEAEALDGVTVYCAGVAAGPEPGSLVTAGGRVVSVTGQGADLATARRRAYEAAGQVRFAGKHHRNDIATTDEGGSP